MAVPITAFAAAGDVPLVRAAKHKDAAAVRALLQQRADVNAAEGDGGTALHWAAYHDEVELVELLLRAGAKVTVVNDLSITPVALASANGNATMVERLLGAGADANVASETGVTPLMRAARTGSAATVRVLLARNANVNAREQERQQTALMWAAAQRHPDVVDVLIAHGADVQARSRVRPVTVMLDSGAGARRVKTSREDAHPINAGGVTALLFAAISGDAASTRLLLKAGANASDSAADGNSALTLAAFSGHGDVAAVLLAGGADPNAAGAGYGPLHVAALRGDLRTVQALLGRGADVNAQVTQGSPVRRFGSQWALPRTLIGATPLFIAASYLEVEVSRALLAAGASPTLALPNGTTPLLAASGVPVAREVRPSDVVRAGISDSDTPVVPRAEADVVTIAQLLLDKGVDVNEANMAGETALHAAALSGSTSLIQLLADRGAQLEAKNKAGQTPLAITLQRGGRGPQQGPATDAQARTKAAEELLRKLGAKQ
jgi:uncharacterized protein